MMQHFPSIIFPFFILQRNFFFHSGYVIKPPQPSSAIYGAPPFTGNIETVLKKYGK